MYCCTSKHSRSSADGREVSNQNDKISRVLVPQLLHGVVFPKVVQLNTVVFGLHNVGQLWQGRNRHVTDQSS